MALDPGSERLTTSTSFELVSLAGDRTRIVERTSHEIRLEPILYWMPMAQWAVDANNGRVLAFLKKGAEWQPTLQKR